MRSLTAGAVLEAWEWGRNRHPIDRAVILHALAAPDADRETLADEPLGRRNRAVLHLRKAAFGSRMSAFVHCPECGEQLELEMDTEQIDMGEPAGSVRVKERVFRLPTSRDLARIVDMTDEEAAAEQLLASCLIEGDLDAGEIEVRGLMNEVEVALEEADPMSDLRLDLSCDACGNDWSTGFDLPGYVWDEFEVYAGRLMNEVHLLAGAYGWSESAILRLSASRRTAYVERVLA